MTAGGVKGQVDGFYRGPDGRPAAVSRVHDGRWLTCWASPIAVSRERWPAVVVRARTSAAPILAGRATGRDLFADLRKVGAQPVTGRGYAWMTDVRGCDPGGSFVRIPDDRPGRPRRQPVLHTRKKMRTTSGCFRSIFLVTLLCGCVSDPARRRESQDSRPGDPFLERQFVLDVLRHVYRWHFDQSYLLEADGLKTWRSGVAASQPALDAGGPERIRGTVDSGGQDPSGIEALGLHDCPR